MTDRDPAERCVDTIGRILANYEAALHLLDATVPAGELLTPVRDACAGLPGLGELVDEAMAATTRDQVAATHSRLIRRRPALVAAAAARPDLTAVAARLHGLERGTHSAGALFTTLRGRV